VGPTHAGPPVSGPTAGCRTAADPFPAGRPRKRRYKSAAEGGTVRRTTKCTRCKQFGHMAKTCNEYVYDSDAPPPAPPKPKKSEARKVSLQYNLVSLPRCKNNHHVLIHCELF